MWRIIHVNHESWIELSKRSRLVRIIGIIGICWNYRQFPYLSKLSVKSDKLQALCRGSICAAEPSCPWFESGIAKYLSQWLGFILGERLHESVHHRFNSIDPFHLILAATKQYKILVKNINYPIAVKMLKYFSQCHFNFPIVPNVRFVRRHRLRRREGQRHEQRDPRRRWRVVRILVRLRRGGGRQEAGGRQGREKRSGLPEQLGWFWLMSYVK